MKETREHPSSLSYFTPERGKVHLQLHPAEPLSTASIPHIAPFKRINCHDPLAHVFAGAFVTDFGSTIKEVHLLIQRDRGPLDVTPGFPLTNTSTNRYWHQAMQIRKQRSPRHSILLANQINGEELAPFAPLFYCQTRSVFFEPPCPACGTILSLCEDEKLLQETGLPSYSTSSHRYLYCEICCTTGSPPSFYTLSKGEDSPATVQDSKQLILSFADPATSNGQHSKLPCLGCQEHSTCFGAQNQAIKVISFLSFYPFHMLIIDCDSLDGFHFLALQQADNLNHNKNEAHPAPETQKIDPVLATTPEDSNTEIRKHLHNLSQKWQRELQRGPPDHQAPGIDITKTLSIPSGDDSSQLETVLLNTSTSTSPDLNDQYSDVTTETVIISSASTPESRDTDLLDETILLSGSSPDAKSPPDKNRDPVAKEQEPKDKGYDLSETIILPPDKKL